MEIKIGDVITSKMPGAKSPLLVYGEETVNDVVRFKLADEGSQSLSMMFSANDLENLGFTVEDHVEIDDAMIADILPPKKKMVPFAGAANTASSTPVTAKPPCVACSGSGKNSNGDACPICQKPVAKAPAPVITPKAPVVVEEAPKPPKVKPDVFEPPTMPIPAEPEPEAEPLPSSEEAEQDEGDPAPVVDEGDKDEKLAKAYSTNELIWQFVRGTRTARELAFEAELKKRGVNMEPLLAGVNFMLGGFCIRYGVAPKNTPEVKPLNRGETTNRIEPSVEVPKAPVEKIPEPVAPAPAPVATGMSALKKLGFGKKSQPTLPMG
jgi:hypothetical protein